MTTATGLGSGVLLIWLYTGFLEPITGVPMPPEVAGVLATSVVALFERFLG